MQVMEWIRQRSAPEAFQHVGFGNLINGNGRHESTFADGPWAMFSTSSSAYGYRSLFVRTQPAAGRARPK